MSAYKRSQAFALAIATFMFASFFANIALSISAILLDCSRNAIEITKYVASSRSAPFYLFGSFTSRLTGCRRFKKRNYETNIIISISFTK